MSRRQPLNVVRALLAPCSRCRARCRVESLVAPDLCRFCWRAGASTLP